MSCDLRQTVRSLVRRPALSLSAVGILGLGIAATALLGALWHAALVAPVSFPDAERLVDVLASRRDSDARTSLYTADFRALDAAADGFVSLGAYEPVGRRALSGGGEAVELSVHRVTADLFPTLGVEPLVGRGFREREERDGSAVVLLSHHLWRDRFAADPGVVGRTVRLDGAPFTVVGVMPGGYGLRGGFPDAWLPLPVDPAVEEARRSGALLAIGRLAPGVDLEVPRAAADAVARRLEASHPERLRDRTFDLQPLTEVMTGGLRRPLTLLLAAAVLVLLVAALNTGGLLLARAVERRREMAIRAGLGAGRGRLLLPALLESLLLALAGGAAGLTMVALALPFLPDLSGRLLYRSIDLSLPLPVVAAVVLITAVAGGAAGLPAALRNARPAALLGTGGGGIGSRRASRASSSLVVAQVALACVLVSAGGALAASFTRLSGADLGFAADGVLSVRVSPPPSRYPDEGALVSLHRRLRDELAAIPGVETVALASGAPGGGWGITVTPAGSGEERSARLLLVGPGFHRAAAIPLVAGRPFTASDDPGSPPVALLAAVSARALFGSESAALGRRLDDEELGNPRVVGVLGDVRPAPGDPPSPTLYLPFDQHAALFDVADVRARYVLVRPVAGDPLALAPEVRRRVAGLDPELPVADVGTLRHQTHRFELVPGLQALTGTSFAAIALLLAAASLSGLAAFSVAQRRREIGLRMALGADRGTVLRGVLGRALLLALAGTGLGVAVAPAVGRLLAGHLYDVSATDPRLLLAAALVLAAVAVTASLGPALRAARLDPGRVLRAE